MKKTGILNSDLSAAIAGSGHTDKLVICDCGLPIPNEAVCIDLSLIPGIPSFIDVLKAIENEAVFEKAYLSKDIQEKNPDILEQTRKILPPDVPFTFLAHEDFKARTREPNTVFVRTGENTPFANIMLVHGVSF